MDAHARFTALWSVAVPAVTAYAIGLAGCRITPARPPSNPGASVTMPFIQLANPAQRLRVANLQRALAFYRDRLGFTVEWVYEGQYASVSCGPRLTFHLQEAQEDVGKGSCYLFCANVDAIHDRLQRDGVAIETEIGDRDYGTRDFALRDPDGNQLTFGTGPRELDELAALTAASATAATTASAASSPLAAGASVVEPSAARIILHAVDLGKMADFLTGTLHLRPLVDERAEGWMTFAAGSVEIALHAMPAARPTTWQTKVVFRVPSVEATWREFKAKGLLIGQITEWNGERMFDLTGPEDNDFQFVEVPREQPGRP